jgi:hypothetical protein
LSTRYAVTDRRVLIWGGAVRRSLTAIELAVLPEARLDDGGGGTGTITFGPSLGFRVPPGWPTMGTYRSPAAFQSIRGVREAFDTIQRAKFELTSDRSAVRSG